MVRKKPRACEYIDAFISMQAHTVSWVNVLLVALIVYQVIMRYFFLSSKVWIEELQWYLYSAGVMLAISYTLQVDGHIRLDIIYSKLTNRKKEIIDFWGLLLFVLPMSGILFYYGLDFTYAAFKCDECSPSPLGLPHRWIIKAIVPLSMIMFLLAALSRMIDTLANIKKREEQKAEPETIVGSAR